MSINLNPQLAAQQYANTVQLLLQQRGSKLANTVMSGTHIGKQASPVDQIGAVTAQKVTTRFGPMQRVDAPTDRRWVFPVDYDLPQYIDTFDQLRLLNDPKSHYIVNGMYAMGRAMDDEIIAAFFGTAKTGENGGTSTAFPAGDVVAVDEGAASATGLTLEKLIAAKEQLLAAEVDVEMEPITACISARQHSDLLRETEIASKDYNEKAVLVDGMVRQFLGINFVLTERLGVDGSSYREVPIFVKSGMYLGKWQEITSSVAQRHDLRGEPWQVYAHGTFGATRLEEGKVIKILCSEA